MPTTRAQSVRSASRTASPELVGQADQHSSQHSTSTPSSSRNLRSSGHPAEHVDVEHIDVSNLSREARALLEDDLAHTPGSQGSPRLPRSSRRSTSLTPSRTSVRETSTTRRGKPSSTRRIEDISVTEDDDDHHSLHLPTNVIQVLPSLSSEREREDDEALTPEAAVEVEAWRDNLNPANATSVDREESELVNKRNRNGDGQTALHSQPSYDTDSETASDAGSDASTASGGTSRTATPRRYAAAATNDDREDEEDLDNLFQRALAKARDAQKMDAAGLQDELQADVMMVAEKTVKERPIPGLSVPSIPQHDLDLSSSKNHQRNSKKDIRQKAEDDRGEGSSRGGIKPVVSVNGKTVELERDTTTYQAELSRKEKMKQPKPQSANQAWASLPTIPSALLPQMKRDYQAMNLANSLDPKRFMKGGAKAAKIPETFAIGTIINPPKRLQSTTLTKERKYNPGSIVQGLVADSDLNGYAKRKYGEFASNRMENGRGKGWKKRKDGDW